MNIRLQFFLIRWLCILGTWVLVFGSMSAFADPDESDLAITLSDAPDPVVLGGDLSYTIVVGNAGPAAASQVVMSHSLPASLTFQSISAPDDWSCTTPESGMAGSISCGKASLDPGVPATFMIIVKPTAAGVIKSSASITCAKDPNLSNNEASVDTTVVSQSPHTYGDLMPLRQP